MNLVLIEMLQQELRRYINEYRDLKAERNTLEARIKYTRARCKLSIEYLAAENSGYGDQRRDYDALVRQVEFLDAMK